MKANKNGLVAPKAQAGGGEKGKETKPAEKAEMEHALSDNELGEITGGGLKFQPEYTRFKKGSGKVSSQKTN